MTEASELYPADRLRCMAMRWLRGRWGDALIVPELSVGNWGSARIDVAAVTADEIIGVEIKGDGDSPSRLARQGWAYGMVATRVFLLPSPSLSARCKKALPTGWGLLHVEGDRVAELAEHNGRAWYKKVEVLENSPGALAGCFWSKEARPVWTWWLGTMPGEHRDAPWFPQVKENSTPSIQKAMGEVMPVAVLRRELCRTLRERNWRRTPFGNPKVVYGPDDPLPVYEAGQQAAE